MMTERQSRDPSVASCSKEPWVMLTFSDDEALPTGATIPPGLRFHLSRCPSCRSIANRLSSVSTALEAIRAPDPVGALTERARSRTGAALRAGARLTGRVVIEDDVELGLDKRDSREVAHEFAGVRRFVALAACVGCAVGLVGLWRLVDAQVTPARIAAKATYPRPEQITSYDPATDALRSRWNAAPTKNGVVDPFPVEADSIYADPEDYASSDFFAASLRSSARSRAMLGKDALQTRDVSIPERILDISTPTVSTMHSTKDRQ